MNNMTQPTQYAAHEALKEYHYWAGICNWEYKEKSVWFKDVVTEFKDIQSRLAEAEGLIEKLVDGLEYALKYSPDCAVDNSLHAGCRDKAQQALAAASNYKKGSV